jgi:hypothetical protein
MNTTTHWHQANNLIAQIVTHQNADDFYITLSPSSAFSVGTFAEDNWDYLAQYWNEFTTLANRVEDEPLTAVLVIRQFTKMRVTDRNLPLKRVAAAVLKQTEIITLSGEEFKEASSFDNKTGKPIKVEPDVSYVDFTKLARQLAITGINQ